MFLFLRKRKSPLHGAGYHAEADLSLLSHESGPHSAYPGTAIPFSRHEDAPEAYRSWEDLLFENRNREYGAYVLRKAYSTHVVVGLSVALVMVSFVFLYPVVSAYFGFEEPSVVPPPRKLIYTELSAPPPIDKPKPIPVRAQLPRLKKIVKFVPPKVVKDEVRELPPTIEEVKQNPTGTEAVEAPVSMLFDEPVEEVVPGSDEIFVVVDQQPEFEGGYEAMMAFIKQNMVYPANARRMKIEGTVHVSFVVGKNGAISEVKVLRGITAECDREAVRVVSLMPAWRPGKQNGRNVNVRYILPLKFRLN